MNESIAYWATDREASSFYSLVQTASIIGSTGFMVILTIVIAIIFLVRRSWRNFFFLLILFLGGIALNIGLKLLIKRDSNGVETTAGGEAYSFPNEHALITTLALLFLIYLVVRYIENTVVKWLLSIALLLILMFSVLSRIVIELYVASDVFGACIVASAWFFLCLFLFYQKTRRQRVVYLHW